MCIHSLFYAYEFTYLCHGEFPKAAFTPSQQSGEPLILTAKLFGIRTLEYVYMRKYNITCVGNHINQLCGLFPGKSGPIWILKLISRVSEQAANADVVLTTRPVCVCVCLFYYGKSASNIFDWVISNWKFKIYKTEWKLNDHIFIK